MCPPHDEDEDGPNMALEKLTFLEFESHGRELNKVPHGIENLPQSNLNIAKDTEILMCGEESKAEEDNSFSAKMAPLLAALTDINVEYSTTRVQDWDGTKFYSDYIAEGLKQQEGVQDSKTVMLFESPSSYSTPDKSTFHNKDKYCFHDWPPPKSTKSKVTLGPCRYASMNGGSIPVFLRSGVAPEGLIEHWKKYIPGFVEPKFVNVIEEEHAVFAYLPMEDVKNHVNDPHVHYHLAGKDAIVKMTDKTTKLLPDTKSVRPCVVKTTHSMGSRGIFIIRDDKDEKEFEEFLATSGNPTYVVTDFVDIQRNIACHFFIHPNGDITWFGSNENKRLPDGSFSSDSYLVMDDQQAMKHMQLPYVQEVAEYCRSLGFWGFCGVDVLFDPLGQGYLVDINPRVTGSCPALMALHQLNKKFGFTQAIFRRDGEIIHQGTPEELLAKVDRYNLEHEGKSVCILHSFVALETEVVSTKVNIGVYGFDTDHCLGTINSLVGRT